MKVRVEVTQEDIEKGKRKAGWACPIARAIKRRVPQSRRRDVFVEHALWEVGYHVRPLPRTAQRFVKRFDAGEPVKPFAFMTEVPD